MGLFDGIGDAVTGTLLGRAVEPQAGEPGPDGHSQEACCLNCGILLVGPYCSACGQKAHVHRSLRAFFVDFATGLFNFEGKIWRTLPMLAWKPGEMTRRYIAGERARFVSPIALYLFSVFLMFAVLNFNGALPSDSTGIKKGIEFAAADERAALARLQAQRKRIAAQGGDTTPLDKGIAAKQKDLKDLERVSRGEPIQTNLTDEEMPPWARTLVNKARENPESFILNVQDAASKYSWLLVPLSVPFLWLLFPFYRRYRLYDHTVFVTYSLSFMMMLVIAGGLLIALGAPGVASMLFLVPPIHMYRQLRGAYQLGRFSALLRTFALVMFAFTAATLFAISLVGIGIL